MSRILFLRTAAKPFPGALLTSRVVSLAGLGCRRLRTSSRLPHAELGVHHAVADAPLNLLLAHTVEPRLVAVNSGHNLLQPRYNLSKGAQGKRGSVSALFSLCRAATLSWDAPSLPCGSQSRRRKNDSAKLVFVVKSPHYYTPICWTHDAVPPEFPYVTGPGGYCKKDPWVWIKNEIQKGTLPFGGSSFLKFDSEKRPFLLPFGSRLIRIGCEQFK